MDQWIEELKAKFTPGQVIDAPEELDAYSADSWPLALKQRLAGQTPFRPQAIFRPALAEEVAPFLAWAAAIGVPVTAWGLGSGVVGAALPTRGGVTLDLSALRQVLWLDETSLCVRVQAGLRGDELEKLLNAHGYTLNHSPQSLDRSTAGGWVATRATGQFSSRWGGMENLLLALRVALSTGEVVETRFAPRPAVGPDLNQLFLGSEGTLGVILEVTLKIFPLPETRLLETLAFPSVAAGLEGMRLLMRAGLRPFLARFYDADESLHVARWAGQEPPSGACLFLVGFEGSAAMAQAEQAAGLQILQKAGGRLLGPAIARGWFDHRFDFSAVENRLATPGGLAETIEVADFWGNILETYQALKAGLAPLADTVLVHFSHAYPHGVSLYLILFGQAADDAAAARQLETIWDTAMDLCAQRGAAIAHHHGIGLARRPYLRRELGASYILLERLKAALDPAGILNPGKFDLMLEEKEIRKRKPQSRKGRAER